MPTKVENKGDMPIKEMSVDDLIVETFNNVILLNCESEPVNNDNKIRIIYSKYRNGQKKYSEHELKQMFIQVLNDRKGSHRFFYSLEAPTRNKYIFKNKNNCKSSSCKNVNQCTIVIKKNNESGNAKEKDYSRSGRTDVYLYTISNNCYIRYSPIEFKWDNPQNRELCQDLLKLDMESSYNNNSGKGYFVLIMYKFNSKTKKSISNKIKIAHKFVCENNKICKINNINISIYILTLINKTESNNNGSTGFYKIELNNDTNSIELNKNNYKKIS